MYILNLIFIEVIGKLVAYVEYFVCRKRHPTKYSSSMLGQLFSASSLPIICFSISTSFSNPWISFCYLHTPFFYILSQHMSRPTSFELSVDCVCNLKFGLPCNFPFPFFIFPTCFFPLNFGRLLIYFLVILLTPISATCIVSIERFFFAVICISIYLGMSLN